MNTDSLKKNGTVLVTGGAGFIGSNLVRKLLSDGFDVTVIDNLSTGRFENIEELVLNGDITFVEGCVASNLFQEMFNDISFDYIFHLACPTGVPNIEILGEEMLVTCSEGTRNVLERARKDDARLLFTSTAEIYGDAKEIPIKEHYTGNVNPVGRRSAYEEGKRFSEALIALYVRKYNVDARIVRVFNTYGPFMSIEEHRVIPKFMRAIKYGDEIVIYGDGKQTRTHLYVDDLVNGLLVVIKKGEAGEVYNVGGSDEKTIRELAENIIALSGRKNSIRFASHFIEDHSRRKPCTEKVCALGWKPTISLGEGLKRTFYANGLQHVVNIPEVVRF